MSKTKTLADLAAEHNAIAAKLGLPPVKGFKCSRAAAEAKVKALRDRLPRRSSMGVGALVAELLAEGKADDEVLDGVHERFPNARTSRACVAWYRCALRRTGALPARH
jgi:hypothetical protein